MTVERIDHLVLTVKDIDETCKFYNEILGMEIETVSPRKRALKFGNQRLTIHQKGRRFEQDALVTTPGPMDICFKVTDSVDEIKAELENKKIPIQGIIERTSASVKVTSIYFRDPDQNLIEVSNYK